MHRNKQSTHKVPPNKFEMLGNKKMLKPSFRSHIILHCQQGYKLDHLPIQNLLKM